MYTHPDIPETTGSSCGKTFSIPRILIAGTSSGCGKTTISRGLMAAYAEQGLVVQPFKVGPDFIDPSHHTRICSRPSRNLDLFMMGEEGVLRTFEQACTGADIAIIEGVMGLYDGMDGRTYGSSAHIARILETPVILVANVNGMANSVHALAQGYLTYDPFLIAAGVICNQVGSLRHRQLIEVEKREEFLGFIPAERSLRMESRHLGLVMGDEYQNNPAALIREHCDIGKILRIARSCSPLPEIRGSMERRKEEVTIAVARDRAFCFYYQDNLDLLRSNGARLVFFSPVQDHLPEADLLYLGGGYPELFATELEQGPARVEIRKRADDGMPVYAECGGLMYLTRGLETGENLSRWVDLLPATSRMESRFQALGYTSGTSTGGPSVAPSGCGFKGHEFHYSRIDCDPDARFAISLNRGFGITNGRDGMYAGESMGSYTHAYFSREYAQNLVAAASAYRNR